MLHADLPPSLELEYVHALKRVEVFLDGQPLRKWSLFAGSGLSAKVMPVLSLFYADKYCVSLNCITDVFAENNQKKQDSLIEQHPSVDICVSEVAHLKGVLAQNKKTGIPRTLLPPVGLMDIGVPCTSRTSLSSKCAQNIDCVQLEKDATGNGFRDAKDVTFTHNPDMAAFECVLNLTQKSSPTATSDAEWMCQQYRLRKWFATYMCLDTGDFGGWVDRRRCWWAMLRELLGDDAVVTAWFSRLITAFKLGGFAFDLPLVHDSAERRKVANSLGMPLMADFGPRESRNKQENCDWKTDHFGIFRANDEQWPIPDFSDTGSHIEYNPFLPREREVAYALDRFFPPMADIEFVDVNPVIGRILSGHLDEDMKVKPNTTPWRPTSPTQVGSGKLVCRYTLTGRDAHAWAPKRYGIRVLEPWESMRMIGWSDCFWSHPRDKTWSLEDMELLHNIAGNAFCIFHLVPWLCAMFATWGKFRRDAAEAPGERDLPNVGNDGDQDSLSEPESD